MINKNETKSDKNLLDDNKVSLDILKAFEEPEIQEIGRTFVEARAKKGLTQEQAGKSLKVRAKLITDFEDGKHLDLPGMAYQIGFVRSYASLVDLDPEICIEAYKKSCNIEDSKITYNFLESNKEKKSFVPIIVLASFLTCLISYSAWYFNNLGYDEVNMPNNKASVDEDKKDKINKTVNYVKVEENSSKNLENSYEIPKKSSGTIINEDLKITEQVFKGKDKKDISVISTTSKFENNKENEIQKNVSEENTNEISAVANERNPETELVLKSSGNSWVEIEDLDGNSLVTRLMRAGETYVIPKNNKGLTLSTGNAGVLSLVYGKNNIPSLGEIGEVISSRPLNIEAFKKRIN